jgi:hypothetical protein
MHYDGMNSPQFQFCTLGSKNATRGRQLAKATYEIIGANEPDFPKSVSSDWSKVFMSASVSSTDNLGGDAMDLNKLRDQVRAAAAMASPLLERKSSRPPRTNVKKAKPPPTPKGRGMERIPKGWSYRRRDQTRGQRPMCKGCNFQIEYGDKCVRRRHFEGKHHVHYTVDQFHARMTCLVDLSREAMDDLLKKRWTDKHFQSVVAKMNYS